MPSCASRHPPSAAVRRAFKNRAEHTRTSSSFVAGCDLISSLFYIFADDELCGNRRNILDVKVRETAVSIKFHARDLMNIKIDTLAREQVPNNLMRRTNSQYKRRMQLRAAPIFQEHLFLFLRPTHSSTSRRNQCQAAPFSLSHHRLSGRQKN